MRTVTVIFLAVLCSAPCVHAKRMKMKQYQQALTDAMERERSAKESLAEEQVQIENLNSEIANVEMQIQEVTQELYAMLGITQEDVTALGSGIAESRMEINSLLELPSEELVQNKDRVERAKRKVASLKQKPAAKLVRFASSFEDLDGLIAQLDQQWGEATEVALARPTASTDSWTVRPYRKTGDCLWNISDKVYGDFLKWEKIYRANTDQIKDPDLIYPGQVLSIPQQ